MKKKIFDIEKIGFGDETYHKPTLPEEKKRSKEPVPIQKREKREITKVVEKRVQNPSVRPVVRDRTPRKTGFTSEEFISPITGRKPKKPQAVHVAHGKYEFRSDLKAMDSLPPTFNEFEFEDQFLTKEVNSLESQIDNDFGENDFITKVVDGGITREPSFLIDRKEAKAHEVVTEKISESQGVLEGIRKEIVEEVMKVQEEVAKEMTEIRTKVEEETMKTQVEFTKEVAEIPEEMENTFANILTDETLNENSIMSSLNHQTQQIIEKKREQQLSENQLQDVKDLLDNVYTKFFCEKDESDEVELMEQTEEIPLEMTLEEDTVLPDENEGVSPDSNQNVFGEVGSVHDVEGVIDILNSEGSVHSQIDTLLLEDGLVVDGQCHNFLDNEGVLNDKEAELVFVPDPLNNHDDNFVDGLTDNKTKDEEPITYYETPSLDLLNDADYQEDNNNQWIFDKMDILNQTFNDFGVKVRLTGEYTQGPTVVQIEIQPDSGTKMSKISGLSNDLKLNLSVEDLRIEPISGKNTIGIEIPNPNRRLVKLKEVLSRSEFVLHESPLYIGLGEDIAGNPVYADILKMPHGLIAGQTGSGKSVCINTLLISILYKASPEEVRLMLIDPKRVELAPYNEIPHLITPVITDEKKAAAGLKWAVEEMERRYELFAHNGVRDITTFNNRRHDFELDYPKMPYIVIVIDELADLMMVSAQEVEDYVMRITQKARAAGIHMIVATQRPTVDVITGTVKSNIPSRIAFTVAQANDSRVILDENGAQDLLGYGDLLWSQSGTKLKRVQCSYITDEEIERVVKVIKAQEKPKYLIEDQFFEKGKMDLLLENEPLVRQSIEFFLSRGHVSATSLQARMNIGFPRATRIIDILEQQGLVSEPQGPNRKREIKVTHEELELIFDITRG